jgi:hypothetical protein
MCSKRNNGSQLSAWEAQKHCACAQIQALKTCRFLFWPGWVLECFLACFWEAFWEPLGHLGITLGYLGVTWDPLGLLWCAVGCPLGSIL